MYSPAMGSWADGLQIGGPVGADVEHPGVAIGGKGIQAQGEHGDLARRTRGFVQPPRIGVVARRGSGGHVTDMVGVFAIGGHGAGRVLHNTVIEAALVEPGKDLLGGVAQFQAQVVDQLQLPGFVYAGEQRQLGKGRSAANQRAPGVVADATGDGGTDAGRADHRMRLAPQGFQRRLQLAQGHTRLGQHLFALAQQGQAGQAQGVDQHHRPVIALGDRGGAAGQAGVGRLADDDGAGAVAALQHAPHLQQAARPHHGEHRPAAIADPQAEAPGRGVALQDMTPSDDGLQLADQIHDVLFTGKESGSEGWSLPLERRGWRNVATRPAAR